ncbi:MAG TPA: radical SAM protein [Halococcus sp.]|nr:radical SAM protein [Halococcus sp.]
MSATVVLVADRSLMSNFRGNYIFGFLSCAPTEQVPDVVYDRLFAPPVEAYPDGRAKAAPMGLRRIESGLLGADEYDRSDVEIAHPHHLDEVVGKETEVIGVNAMDPLGRGPVTSSFTGDGDLTPMNSVKFKSLMNRIRELNYDGKLVVGGAGSWQLDNEEMRTRFGIDHIVQGEASYMAPELFADIRSGEADTTVFCDSPDSWDRIPEIRGPTVNGLIEAMRGCGRGCDFCGPDMRRNLYPPVERLQREAEINAEAGFNHIWLHSEDILLYDFEGRFEPNHEAILDLYKGLLDVDGIEKVSATHMSLAAVCRAPELIADIADVNGLGPGDWTGVQPGIETVSPKLVEQHIGGKPAPYEAEEWPEVVERGIRILNDNYIYPACTIIVGLPGETDEDIQYTIDLIHNLKDTHCIVAPLMYMDYVSGDSLTLDTLSPKQWELLHECGKHDMREIRHKAWKATKGWNPLSRVVSQGVAWFWSWLILRGLDSAEPTPAEIESVAKTQPSVGD